MAGSVPLALLAEGVGHPVVVELKNGEMYRGFLQETEESMNVELERVTHTAQNGQQRRVDHVLIRGSNIRVIVLPDFLKSAPIFERVRQAKKRQKEALSAAATGRAKPKASAARNIFRAPGAL